MPSARSSSSTRRTGFPGSVARPAAIYGPDNNIHDMETAMFLRLRRGLPILLPHEGLVTTSYGHVDDLCRNLLEMAALPAAAGEIVNITGDGASVAGLHRAARRHRRRRAGHPSFCPPGSPTPSRSTATCSA